MREHHDHESPSSRPDEGTPPISRRLLLGSGAVGVGAIASGVLGATPALASGAPSATEGIGALGLGAPAFVPVTAPGAQVGVLNFTNAVALADGVPANLIYGNGGVYSTTAGAFLNIPIPLPTGSRLLRVDLYWKRASTGTSTSSLNLSYFETGNNYVVGSMNTTGTGIISGAYVFPTPTVVDKARQYYVETSSATTAGNVLLGCIYQYYPATPQLHVFAQPGRAYDSRPGNNPATGVKVPLGGGSLRSDIDARGGGVGVPIGASAILANVTVVNTQGVGYIGVYKNGIGIVFNSTVNWFGPNQILANTTVIALDSNAKFAAFVPFNSSTDFFVDVLGYYL